MNREAGFTLIEVLVAVVILSVGLLGLAATQAVGLRLNQSAYHRGQATLLAYDMADRIRANPVDAAKFATSVYTTKALGAAVTQPTCKTTTGCTPAQMAEQDLFEWRTTLAAALPSGTGSINVSGSLYTLRVTWDDIKEAADSQNTADTFFEFSFQL
jgi:type IV pilus assembly protein PilV